MYEDLKDVSCKYSVIRIANLISCYEHIQITDIKSFNLEEINKITENDLIVSGIDRPEGTSILKPDSIYQSKDGKSIALGHKLLGTMYYPYRCCMLSRNIEGTFEGFTCLVLRGKLCEANIKSNDIFILKCKENRFSNEIIIDDSWVQWCNENVK